MDWKRPLDRALGKLGLTRTQAVADSAHGMIGRISLPGRGDPPRRDTHALLKGWGELPWLRAVTSKVATGVAQVEWVVLAKKERGPMGKFVKDQRLQFMHPNHRKKALRQARQDGEVQEIKDHPALMVLNRPTPLFTGISIRSLTQIYMEVSGEAFEIVERSYIKGALGMGIPKEIWPIPPHWVTGTPTPNHPAYTVSFRGFQKEIPEQDVYWHKSLDPVNPFGRGLGLAASMKDELEADEAAAALEKGQFLNRARPETIVGLPGISEQLLKKVQNDFEGGAPGIANFFRTHFVNVEPKIEQTGHTFENLQLIDLRRFHRDTIRQILGLPPEILGIIENSNRSTIDASDYLNAKHVLEPRLEYWREQRQMYLMPEYDDRLILDYVSPVEADKEFALKVATQSPFAFTQDEKRELAGLDPIEGGKGKVYVGPGTLVAVEDPAELLPAEPAVGPDGLPLNPLTPPQANPNAPPGEGQNQPPKPQPGQSPQPPPRPNGAVPKPNGAAPPPPAAAPPPRPPARAKTLVVRRSAKGEVEAVSLEGGPEFAVARTADGFSLTPIP